MPFTGTVWFDFVCPSVARLSRLLETAEQEGAPVELDWRPFSLEQVNRTEDELRLWETPERSGHGAIHALATFAWVREEAPYAASAYRRSLLFLRHDEEADLGDWGTYQRAASLAGLEGDRLVMEVRDRRAGYQEVGRFHREAVELGVFGVPTLVGEAGLPLFVKLMSEAEQGDAGELLEQVGAILDQPAVWELKRPPI